MAGQLDDAAKQILGTLLADFSDRGLTAQELKNGYEGPNIEALATAVCNVADFTTVDFEVAFSDLENAQMIRTGPTAFFDNDENSSVMFIGTYSKREYVYMTENGYKAARKAPNRPQTIQRIVNNLTITGGQFSNMQLGQGENVNQSMSVTTEGDSETVNKLISILESQGVQATEQNRADIVAAVEEANKGNAGTAKSFLEKAFGTTWGIAQKLALPIIIAKIREKLGM